jgi:hypothetical protein
VPCRSVFAVRFYNIRLHTGIMRHAREADWVQDDNPEFGLLMCACWNMGNAASKPRTPG